MFLSILIKKYLQLKQDILVVIDSIQITQVLMNHVIEYLNIKLKYKHKKLNNVMKKVNMKVNHFLYKLKMNLIYKKKNNLINLL